MDEQRRLELWASLAIRHTKGIGVRKAHALVQKFGSAYAAVEAKKALSTAWQGIISDKACHEFSSEHWREPALIEWRAIQQACDVSFILYTDPEYPSLLRETCDPPLVLYYKGDISLLSNPMIGVVGARNCTREGIRMCLLLAKALSHAGVTVVSGMARGIDRAAHLSGLSGVGSSVAVLGTGVDIIYPKDNTDLAMCLSEHGLLISEFAPGVKPQSRHFPIRNRIISGVSLGLVVIEASEKSGSLITARMALEQNREVFAVPGHMTAPVSAGCRELIRSGAKAVFTVDDIFMELGPLLDAALREQLAKRETISHEKMLTDMFSDDIESSLPLPLFGSRKKITAPTASAHTHVTQPSSSSSLPSSLSPEFSSPSAFLSSSSSSSSPSLFPQGYDKGHTHNEHRAPIDRTILSEEEILIVDALQEEALHIDAIVRSTSLTNSVVSATLTSLEMKGIVRRLPGMIYHLV